MNAEIPEVQIWNPHDLGIISEILAAASATHGIPNKGPEWFLWKFRDSPWGPAVVAYAHTQNGRMAGAVSFGMYQLKMDNSVVTAGISYETFVHPDYQRQGLFGRLLEAAEKEAETRGVEILFNFPNQASIPGFIRAGWSDVGGVGTWLSPVRPIRASRALVANLRGLDTFEPGAAREGHIRHLAANLPQISAPIPLRPRSGPVVRRDHDPKFLVWRLANAPLFDYRLIQDGEVSALIRIGVRSGYREAQVMEVFSDYYPSLSSVRRLLKRISAAVCPDTITILTSRGNPITGFLPFLRFIPVPNRVNFFVKQLGGAHGANLPGKWAISGVDIHTW